MWRKLNAAGHALSKRTERIEAKCKPCYSETVKNITVTVDDETYRGARIKAAEQGSSVSALVRDYLVGMARGETEFERLKREEAALRATISNFRASDNLSREAIHERRS